MLRLISLVAVAVLLTACAGQDGTPTVKIIDTGCDWTQYIYVTGADLDVMGEALAQQIESHNVTRERICDGKGSGSETTSR